MQSKDYQTSQHLRDQVVELKQKAPGLERYGRAKELMKDLKYEIQELEHFMRDISEDLSRLKIRQKYLMKTKIKEPDQDLSKSMSDISQSRVSDISCNSKWIKANMKDNWILQDITSSSSGSSSQSLRGRIMAENFFHMKTNSSH